MRLLEILEKIKNIPDPELPFVSIGELGMIHTIEKNSNNTVLNVQFIPSFLGCPATELIINEIRKIGEKYISYVKVEKVFHPIWNTNRITIQGLEKLETNGIGTPTQTHCPYCKACGKNIEMISTFGSTPCKKLMRCLDCKNPFEVMKCNKK